MRDDIFIGVNALDYSGYPDCRPEFIAQFEKLAPVVETKAGVNGVHYRIHAPLIEMTKAQIIRKAVELGVQILVDPSFVRPDARRQGAVASAIPVCYARKVFAKPEFPIRRATYL